MKRASARPAVALAAALLTAAAIACDGDAPPAGDAPAGSDTAEAPTSGEPPAQDMGPGPPVAPAESPADTAEPDLREGMRPGEWQDAGGEWRMARKNHASTAYSALDQITVENVGRLQVAWTFSTGEHRGHEAAPVVVGETMYIVTPWPNRVYALDLTEPGRIRWSYDPEPARAAQGVACCDVVNRGVAYADGRIVFNTLDVHTVALDAETGEELWTTRLGDFNTGETMTMAPLIVGDRVIVGNSGADIGVRGWIAGLDLETGEVAWRAYSTGPDEDVLIGEDFEPYYEKDRGEDLGVSTWPSDRWRVGGGAVWGFVSYDPELDLIYHGTANPGPWNALVRPGDNKWTVTHFARDPQTGSARWAYQTIPHDEWDHDGINESVLANLTIEGEERRVLMKPERNGYVYVLDRETGEVISTGRFGPVNVSTGVDLETGELLKNPDISPEWDQWVRDVCPAAPGAKDWQPSAFSPRTELLYIPRQHLCMDWKAVEVNYISGTPWVGVEASFHAGPGGHRGEFQAWDPVAQEEVWAIEEEWPVWSGAMVTAGDVAFYGTLTGELKAVDARTGDRLWSFRTGSGIVGQPVTYRGPDGRQYVAVLSGIGGWAGAPVILRTRTPTAAIGFGNATGGLNDEVTLGGTLYVFALPEGDG